MGKLALAVNLATATVVSSLAKEVGAQAPSVDSMKLEDYDGDELELHPGHGDQKVHGHDQGSHDEASFEHSIALENFASGGSPWKIPDETIKALKTGKLKLDWKPVHSGGGAIFVTHINGEVPLLLTFESSTSYKKVGSLRDPSGTRHNLAVRLQPLRGQGLDLWRKTVIGESHEKRNAAKATIDRVAGKALGVESPRFYTSTLFSHNFDRVRREVEDDTGTSKAVKTSLLLSTELAKATTVTALVKHKDRHGSTAHHQRGVGRSSRYDDTGSVFPQVDPRKSPKKFLEANKEINREIGSLDDLNNYIYWDDSSGKYDYSEAAEVAVRDAQKRGVNLDPKITEHVIAARDALRIKAQSRSRRARAGRFNPGYYD